MDEPTLVANAAKGDRDAMQEMFRANRQRIFKLALHYTRNVLDAQDILQEVFIKVPGSVWC